MKVKNIIKFMFLDETDNEGIENLQNDDTASKDDTPSSQNGEERKPKIQTTSGNESVEP